MPPAARPAQGYSRLVRWMKVALPLGALVTMAAIFLLGRSFDTGESLLSPQDLAALGAGLRLEAPRFAGRTPAGEPYAIRADWAEPESAVPDRIRLHRPEGGIETEDGREIAGRADTGLLVRSINRLALNGNVRLDTSDGYAFRSRRVVIEFSERVARSDDPVTLTGPEGRLEAGSMRIEQGRPGRSEARISFEQGVRVVFIPREARRTDGQPRAVQ